MKDFKEQSSLQPDIIIGRNAVLQALDSGRTIDSLFVAKGEKNGSIFVILKKCKEKGIVVKEVDRKKLDLMCGEMNHQNVIAKCAAHEYSTVEDILNLAKERGEEPFIIICDELEDPHNLGAIIRTAEITGAHGVIIPKRRSVTLSYTVAKTSAGAIEYVPVAKVGNLANEIEKLKKLGLWIYAADMNGEDWCKTDFTGATALVIGSEGKGVSRLVKEKCDVTVSLPMKGKINSLNASVAAGILMMEVSRQRSDIKRI
ncbi:MAG: 23S rRNA (guanosine(2251)-2'-O)-methyltransferase RlmB [Clostridia bacterium]|nr:23S rRNA (guanosine(2251)-2'-O)-methyltransferase RlmB [Clostridia bacterium]